ncbi:biotin transporter BioY [Pseudoramibacter sp.]|jgi:biotin transport system substrate-specific component|uniref:biotin transporter BioY n=1 Tax=Pseudoramibacter sp. TaxID=2034862 RepID=UPI0025D5BE25|nr:biotin transporter BioY [Pseudoramibacter sp.]MCH4072167.1 biotin transporter BioY [Pseudoramibacter sp.]MCH4105937.1 biotin transporter BioY [Pseudoramibacter sp.]
MSNKLHTRNLIFAALLAAFMAIIGPLSIPLPGGVPLSLLTFGLFLSAYLLGWRLGTLSVLIYLLLGLVGLPIFSGFTAGAGRLFGPTGGYLIGYIPAALIAGKLCAKHRKFLPAVLSMLAGSVVCLAIGTFWYMGVTHTALIPALIVCVVPFIPGDIAKMAGAAAVGRILSPRLTAYLQKHLDEDQKAED